MSHNRGDHHHGHSFDPENWRKLESDERRARMDPKKLAAAMGLAGNETALDIGVGTGFFAVEVAPLCRKLIGVDHSPKMLEVLRGKEAFARLGNMELLEGKAEKLPVEDRSADVAFHVNLFHEVADMAAFHGEIQRVLKPGGRLFMADWRAIQTASGPPLEHRIPEEKAKAFLERDGFTDIQALPLYEDHYVFSAKAGEGKEP
jgi:ubiquinone/menaquinone biosynthesis C-methylase UbiE